MWFDAQFVGLVVDGVARQFDLVVAFVVLVKGFIVVCRSAPLDSFVPS